jgi:hypothetical protein
MPSDYPGAFAALREILRRHSDGMIIQSDTPTDFTVIMPAIGPNKKPIWFGAVLLKKSAVTYHIFSLYFNPAMQAAVPAELLKRKQGKTCFNFQQPDPDLFARLDELTALGRQNFERHGLLKPGPIANEQLAAMFKAAGGNLDALATRRKKMAKQAAEKRAATIAKKKKAAKPAAGRTKGK